MEGDIILFVDIELIKVAMLVSPIVGEEVLLEVGKIMWSLFLLLIQNIFTEEGYLSVVMAGE